MACQLAAAALLPQSIAFAPNSIVDSTLTRLHQNYSPSQQSQSKAFTAKESLFTSSALSMSEQNTEQKSTLPVFLDPGTKGGAIVLSLLLFVVPIIIYNVATGIFGMDGASVGRNIGVGFSVVSMIMWAASYIFRVATKDMTYAKQLKDYEDAVIAKRLEELDEDEVQALVEDIER